MPDGAPEADSPPAFFAPRCPPPHRGLYVIIPGQSRPFRPRTAQAKAFAPYGLLGLLPALRRATLPIYTLSRAINGRGLRRQIPPAFLPPRCPPPQRGFIRNNIRAILALQAGFILIKGKCFCTDFTTCQFPVKRIVSINREFSTKQGGLHGRFGCGRYYVSPGITLFYR
jgi:hypothetical protein